MWLNTRMDDADLHRAVERLGATLEASGVPPMAARVFAYVLAEDREQYTARDLAEGLQVSPAAVSGAMKFLVAAGLVIRERRRGGRGHVFRVIDNDIWTPIMEGRVRMLEQFRAAADDAVELLAPGSAGRARVEETRDYLAFAATDMARMIDRWHAHRTARTTDG